jgi:hypothetical protein
MLKGKTTGLAGRKRVRLGPKGGSISEGIPAWICWSMSESKPYFLPLDESLRSPNKTLWN